MKARFFMLFSCLAALLPLTASAAGGPPATTNAVQWTVNPAVSPDSSVVDIQLRSGRAKTILRVEVEVEVSELFDDPVSGVLNSVNVNGVDIPLASASLSCSHPTSTCSIVATGWLDLDAAEAQNPGVLIGEPLDVNVSYTHVYTTDGEATVRILASLLKK